MDKYLINLKTVSINAAEKNSFNDVSTSNCIAEYNELSFEDTKNKRLNDENTSSNISCGTQSKRVCSEKSVPSFTFNVMPSFTWRTIAAENLELKYAKIFSKSSADYIFQRLEEEVEYFSGDLLKVRVYGKWHNIPRKQVSYGDPGLSYSFSGICIPAKPWSNCSTIAQLKEIIERVSGHSFNFVLVNRYKDGTDHMGEHRDDEKDLERMAPIASLSLGQARDFIFRHKDSRGTKGVRKISPVKLELEHGSLLLMQWPTNNFWYHSLPVRKKALNVRINLTFRQMVIKPK